MLIGIRAVSVSSIFFSLIEGDVLSVLWLQVKPVSMLDEIFKLKTANIRMFSRVMNRCVY